MIFVALILVTICTQRHWLIATESAGALLERGQLAFAEDQIAMAANCAERCVSLSPELASGWKLVAESAGRTGQFDRAFVALEEYARQRPDDAFKLAVRLGRDWMMRNQVGPAKQALKLAERFEVDGFEALKLQEQIASVTGHGREAARCIMELLKRKKFGRGEMMLITSVAPGVDDPKRLDAILRADPQNKSPQLALAVKEMNNSQHAVAEAYLLTITQAHPDDVEAVGLLAELYATFMPEKFLGWHADLLPQATDDVRVWAARGRWLAGIGKIDAAIRCLHESLERDPVQLSTTALLGQLLKVSHEMELGNAFSERAYRLQRIIDLNTRMNDPHSNDLVLPLVLELEATGRLREAWGWCIVQEQADPSHRHALSQIRQRLEQQLYPELPRTKPGSVPGTGFAWNRYPLPDWTQLKPVGSEACPEC